jgi:hypothetical protein
MKVFTKRRVIRVGSIAVFMLTLSLGAFFYRLYAIGQWLDAHRAVETMIYQLRTRVPDECDADSWGGGC